MFKLHVFPSLLGLPALMKEYFNVEKKARGYRRQLMAAANRARGEGRPSEVVNACVSLARQMGRVERHATYMARSAACQYDGVAYDRYWGSYKSYRQS